jgi:hypothetical protein
MDFESSAESSAMARMVSGSPGWADAFSGGRWVSGRETRGREGQKGSSGQGMKAGKRRLHTLHKIGDSVSPTALDQFLVEELGEPTGGDQ